MGTGEKKGREGGIRGAAAYAVPCRIICWAEEGLEKWEGPTEERKQHVNTQRQDRANSGSWL